MKIPPFDPGKKPQILLRIQGFVDVAPLGIEPRFWVPETHALSIVLRSQNQIPVAGCWWRYGDSNPGPLACHASALAS